MNFLIVGIFLGLISEFSVSLIVVVSAIIVVALIVRIAIAIHNRKMRVNKQKLLKAEAAQRQAVLDEKYFQKKAKLLENRARAKVENDQKEAERFARWEKKLNSFRNSSEYEFIRQFVQKNENKGSRSEFLTLQLILENQQWTFSLDELEEIIQQEYWQKLDDFINERVIVNDPSDFNQAIKIFLEQCYKNNFEMVTGTRDMVKKDNFQENDEIKNENVLFDHSKATINKSERKAIEFENFEKMLEEEDDEQVWLEYIG